MGFPRGQCSGPLLFILYSNDLPIALKNCHTILFADDTTIYTTGTDLLDIFTRINTDLDVLNDWFMANNCRLTHQKLKLFYILKRGDNKFKFECLHGWPKIGKGQNY